MQLSSGAERSLKKILASKPLCEFEKPGVGLEWPYKEFSFSELLLRGAKRLVTPLPDRGNRTGVRSGELQTQTFTLEA